MTLEPVSEKQPQEAQSVDRWLKYAYTINWEVIAYLIIFVLALVTRFADLGSRVMSHDESLHTKFAWDLAEQGNFQHTPLMHGPLLFVATAFFYTLFGDNDFTARIFPALLGVLVVMFPILFRRWLGKTGAVIASVLLLASPLLMYYSRYIRHDMLAIFFALVMFYAVFQYLDGPERVKGRGYWLVLLAGAMSLLLASKEVAFIYIAIFGSFLTLFWLFALMQRYLRLRGARSLFYAVTIGIVLGMIATLALIVVLSVIPLNDFDSDGVANVDDNCVSVANPIQLDDDADGIGNDCLTTAGAPLGGYILTATLAIFGVLGVALLGTALWVMRGDGRFPWRTVLLVLVIATLTCVTLLVVEEASHTEVVTATPVDPNAEEGVVAAQTSWLPIIAVWVIGLLVVGAAVAGWMFNFWQELRRDPVFDVLIMMGTLVLPWLTAFAIFATGASPTDYTPDGILRASVALVPFAVVSVVVGLMWNWRTWLAAMGVFLALYAFFFTTMFTNGQGLASGMIGSLGYWLEQQGVRRGSQPQYYYTLIMTPFYEFLPLIGGALAGIYGLILFWRSRLAQMTAATEMLDSALTEELLAAAEASMDDTVALETLVSSEPHTPIVPVMPDDVRSALDDEIAESLQNRSHLDLIPAAERMLQMPFMLFVGYWTLLSFYAYTLSGEKMPWLTTHLTIPLILATGWFGGRVMDGISARSFKREGWKLFLLIPLFLIAFWQVFNPLLVGKGPFQGVTKMQLEWTGVWLAALAVTLVVAFVMARMIRRVGWGQFGRVFLIGLGIILVVLTFRSAFMASFINYDLATEFLVYAHAGPAHTTVFDWMEEISQRTTGGQDLKVAYDFKMSWPGSWYFREYPSAVYFDRNPSVQVLDDAVMVVIGSESRGQTEPLLGDRYYHYEFIRMWWPMQDYFNWTWDRVKGVFDLSPNNANAALLRQGLWDIWWDRDYTTYGRATGGNFKLTEWPVSDRMHVYVRKDVAAQVWDLGVGAEVISEFETSLADLWTLRSASLAWGSQGPAAGQLDHPRGVAAAADGTIYVADSMNHRIQAFSSEGEFLREWGVYELGEHGTATGGNFNQPWGIAVGPDDNIYVADTWNHRVQVFTPEGEFIRTWGQLGQLDAAARPNDFWGPRDIAVDADGLVYVADTGNKRIRVYTAEGEFIHDIGSGGAGAGELNEPVGLTIHPDGRLFVADTWNRRIQVFDLDGQFLSSWAVSAWFGEQGNRPYLALDPEREHLYVTDPDAARVLVYDFDGTMLGSFGQPGPEDVPLTSAQFNVVGGVAIGPDGQAFVADAGTGRLLRFEPWDELLVVDELPPEVVDPVDDADSMSDDNPSDDEGAIDESPDGEDAEVESSLDDGEGEESAIDADDALPVDEEPTPTANG